MQVWVKLSGDQEWGRSYTNIINIKVFVYTLGDGSLEAADYRTCRGHKGDAAVGGLHALVHEEVLADLAEHLSGLMHIWGRRRWVKINIRHIRDKRGLYAVGGGGWVNIEGGRVNAHT